MKRALDVMRRGALPKFDREVIAVVGDVRGWLESVRRAQRRPRRLLLLSRSRRSSWRTGRRSGDAQPLHGDGQRSRRLGATLEVPLGMRFTREDTWQLPIRAVVCPFVRATVTVDGLSAVETLWMHEYDCEAIANGLDEPAALELGRRRRRSAARCGYCAKAPAVATSTIQLGRMPMSEHADGGDEQRRGDAAPSAAAWPRAPPRGSTSR